jgi:hypothetical protein
MAIGAYALDIGIANERQKAIKDRLAALDYHFEKRLMALNEPLGEISIQLERLRSRLP